MLYIEKFKENCEGKTKRYRFIKIKLFGVSKRKYILDHVFPFEEHSMKSYSFQ